MKTMKRTMNRIYALGAAALLMLAVSSCREDSDALIPYGYADNSVYKAAQKSFAAQFKILWNGLSQNYGIWDVEKDLYGLDWDAVYDKMLPRFEALDRQDYVSDQELQTLLDETMAPLHDGHIFAELFNFHTRSYLRSSPSKMRNATRPDIQSKTHNVWPETYGDDIIESRQGEVSMDAAYEELSREGVPYLERQITELGAKTTPTEMEASRLRSMIALNEALKAADDMTEVAQKVATLNLLAAKYADLTVPGLQAYTPSLLDEHAINVQYVLFKGNIAYLRFNTFELSTYLTARRLAQLTAAATAADMELIRSVSGAWEAWFGKIQKLKAAGQLGGVIIDLRNNNGGDMDDYAYVVGALVPDGDFEYAKCRFKRGVGRYDYSPLMPMAGFTLIDRHVTVTEPVVALVNCNSISMAEMNSLGVKKMSNGRVIGMRTWGGLCGLQGPVEYGETYASHIGQRRVTPVYAYVPTCCMFSDDGQSYEGIGVVPDIEVALDEDAYESTGRDTQLDRALQYIRTGN